MKPTTPLGEVSPTLWKRIGRLIAVLAACVALAIILGLQTVIEYRDLECPEGTAVQYRSIGYWTAYCAPFPEAAAPSTVPTARYVGIFFTNIQARLFDADLIAGTFHGPALGVRPGR